MSQITCRDLTLGYEGQAVVRNINFEVNTGDYLCIIGENGSGKSTLIKTLLHLITPMQGSITLGDGLLPNEIGYLPQQTQVQRDFPASVWEIVCSGTLNSTGPHLNSGKHEKSPTQKVDKIAGSDVSRRSWNPFLGKYAKNLAKQNMEYLHIENLAGKCYRELSGGQQQRVLLARALCATGKLLLLDEPVAGLDPQAGKKLYDLIYRLNRERKLTIIMVTHDIAAADAYASHILHIGEQPLFFGTAEEYRISEIGKHYIGLTGGMSHV